MRRLLIVSCLITCPALAQDRDVERALLQRQQQSDEFALQLRQSQQRLQLSPGDLNQQQYLEAQHLAERHRLENAGAKQQLSIGLDAATSAAQDRQRAERARQGALQAPFELRLPPPLVRAPITPRPKESVPYFPGYE